MFSPVKKNVSKMLTFQLHPKLPQYYKAAIALVSVVILTAILWVRLPSQTVTLKVGDVAMEDIRAPRSVLVVNRRETERRRREAAESVPPQYPTIDPTVKEEALQRVRATFQTVRAFQADARRLAMLKDRLAPMRLSDGALQTLLRASPSDVDRLAQETVALVTAVYTRHYPQIRSKTDDLKLAHQRIAQEVKKLRVPPAHQSVIAQIARRVVRVNSMFNEELTEKARRKAMRAVKPVTFTVQRGELIVQRGEEITPEIMDKLVALGLVRGKVNWIELFALFALSAFLLVIVAIYVYQHVPQVYREPRLLALLALVPLVGMSVFKLGRVFAGLEPILAAQVTAAVGMLIAILLNAQLAMVVALAVSILTTMMMSPAELSQCLTSLGGAIVGIYCVTSIASRKQLIKTGFALAGTNVFLAIVFGVLQGAPGMDLLLNCGWGVINGVACVIITLGAVMFLERPFGITTHLRLLELSDPNEPILRRMQMEAPGTATHSLLVGNLAESAAKAIGADALFCRVACLYHDIGKLKRPHCFAENQFGGDNVHDRINPSLSALVVIAHVKDGIELAKQLKLPQPIIDIIPQHHGTSLVSFFYQRAVESQGGDVREDHFRYPGPKPQTKEAAIIMLADSVEAAARTLAKPTPNRIEQLVRSIIRSRLEDGQLSECDITLMDLERITQTFTHVLQGLLHSRVEYPDAPWGEKHDARASGYPGALPAPPPRVGAARGLRRIAGRED
ncbi:MAG: HDIG domain-containing protein [Abditibacteriales bacterium]|nr:HDIG domain-containing protein [Abditibacteriales bacterium]MDW8367360.1 HDIG domain-containing protein [Abditibacteriales bacterium]